MFEFLFKRQGDKTGKARGAQAAAPARPAAKPGQGAAAQAQAATPAREIVAQRDAQRAQQAAQLAALGGDEALAVEFILACEFSELRLAAAELVHGRAALERVHGAMRNLDRRVAKLMQARLEALRHHDAEQARAEAALAQAQAMLDAAQLTPNQVADLDRKWAGIAAPQLQQQFAPLRARLGARLEQQVALQRAMIDRLAALRRLETQALDAPALAASLAALAAEQDAALAAPEQASLPRALVAEFASEQTRLAGTLAGLEQVQAALHARAAALAEWQAQPEEQLQADALRRSWQKLPALPANEAGAALEARFDTLLASLPQPARVLREGGSGAPRPAGERRAAPDPDAPAVPEEVAADARRPPAAKGADQAFLDKLDALEAALQQGSLAHAAELDKALKESKGKGMRLNAPQADRLAHLRDELKRLSDWARWGGNVSREELIKTVEDLPTQQLPMAELAKKVGSMRERWKALDSLSGAAPKSLWERFDQACSVAYAPAALHFRQLADERHANAAKGEAIVAEAHAEIARLGQENADWKHVAATVQRLRLAWSHLGPIDRKDKKRLDTLFGAALTTLQGPLELQRKAEVAQREALIDEVAAIDAHDRHALDQLRAIQARWQEHARALPLERKAEQALWQRFRGACDSLFARRKESAHELDAERRAHEQAKDAISARLEQAAERAAGGAVASDAAHPDADTGAGAPRPLTPAAVATLLREALAEWQAIGPVPRAHEARVEKRYQAAIARLQQQLEQTRRAAGLAQAGALREKLRACQQLEQALADLNQQVDSSAWRARWAALAIAGAPYDAVLATRFDAAIDAVDEAATGTGTDEGKGIGSSSARRAAYAQLLEANRTTLLARLLREEVAAGIDSGAEFARERLKLQVETLQSALKEGARPGARQGSWQQLCALPALADARTALRLEQVLMHAAREGK